MTDLDQFPILRTVRDAPSSSAEGGGGSLSPPLPVRSGNWPGGIMTHDLPPEPLRSCPRLNWLMKPGEPVRWYERDPRKQNRAEAVWVEITEADARQIAREDNE